MMKKTPEPYRDRLTAALHELAGVLQTVQQGSQRWQGWRRLQLVDEHEVAHIAPYTSTALATLEQAYALNENDGDLIHHLAIAYHAMAWDMEIDRPEQAAEIWEQALFYWRKLQACEPFWQKLYTRGALLSPAFDKTVIEEIRSNLIQFLLEIHVEFIRYYFDVKRYDQASWHVRIIQRARIPLAARKRLAELVYESTTSTVPVLMAEGHFSDALSTLDIFLDLFPSHPTALKNYLEIGIQWLKQLSPLNRWQEILNLDKRVLPKWDKLYKLTASVDDLSVRTALGDLAETIGSKYWIKVRNMQLQREETNPEIVGLKSQEYSYCLQAITWFRKAISQIPNYETELNLMDALVWKAGFLTQVGLRSTTFDEIQQLLDDALSTCAEAIELNVDQSLPRQQAAQILELKEQFGKWVSS
ncbi:MAG: hypothetical protein U1F76_19880 [Candidatus Competibacteraceae bacterium]